MKVAPHGLLGALRIIRRATIYGLTYGHYSLRVRVLIAMFQRAGRASAARPHPPRVSIITKLLRCPAYQTTDNVMQHQFQHILIDNNDTRPHFRCKVCRQLAVARSTDQADMQWAVERRGPCPGAFVKPPHQSIQFAARVARWLKANMPRRSAGEVTSIWTSCCEPCEQRGKEESICGACACRVLPSGPPECNLIAMATEKCPIGKWS